MGAVTTIEAIVAVRQFLHAEQEDVVLRIITGRGIFATIPLRGVVIRVRTARAVVHGGQDDQLLLQIGECRIVEGVVQPSADIGERIVVWVACSAVMTEGRRTA